MAGLLDFLNTDDAKLGLGLLAAGGPSTVPLSFGQRLQGAMQGLEVDKQQAMRTGLLKSQIDENATQAELRKQQLALALRKQAMDEQFMGAGLLGSGAPAQSPTAAAPGSPMAAGPAGAAPAQGGFNAQAISQKFGIPVEAVIADYRFNGGKKIAELVAKRAEPNWMNVGGNLVDTNAAGFKGGLQDQVNISNDGRATVLRANGGNPVVGAPDGALATYGAYQGIANRSNADFTPERVIDQTTGQMVVRPRSQVLQPAASGAPAGYATEANMRTTAQGDMGADPKAVAREIRATQNDLMKPGLDEGSKAALRSHLAQLQGTAKDIGIAPTAGNVVELSPAEQAANKAAEVKAVEQVKADITPTASKTNKFNQANDAIGIIDKALKHPGLESATGMAGTLDPRNYIPGTNAKDFQIVLDQLKGGAFLTAFNELKGGGAITETEGRKAEDAIARLNRAQTTASFKEALGDYRAILERGLKNSGQIPSTGGATGSFDAPAEKKAAPKVLDALPTANSTNKGQRIRDTTTGKILRSDGMQWKAE